MRFWQIGRNRQNVGSGRFDPEIVARVKEMGLYLVYHPNFSGSRSRYHHRSQDPFASGWRVDREAWRTCGWVLTDTRHQLSPKLGMVQKRPFSGNTWDFSADPDRSRVGAGLREALVAGLELQFCENRVYPRSSSQ